MIQSWRQKLRYMFQGFFVYIAYVFFRVMPIKWASGFGGWLFFHLGPKLPSTKVARLNLEKIFPEKTEEERENIILGMWKNLGRTVGEYPHLYHIEDYVEVEGSEYLEAAKSSGTASIFLGAHLANWEMGPMAARKSNLDVHVVYRRPNNPWVDKLLRYLRGAGGASSIAKGGAGAREMLSVLKKKEALGVLVDQKLNEGVSIPFLGVDAMTAPAVASFALKFHCPLYMIRIERLDGVQFKVTISPPLHFETTGDREEDIRNILTKVNDQISLWIKERPEQWLWIHRRWPKDFY